MVGEEQRIRHFTMNFFIADETLEIWEKKQSNSGMSQVNAERRGSEGKGSENVPIPSDSCSLPPL